jgi:hypothetical protein
MSDESSREVLNGVAEATRQGIGHMSSEQLDQGWRRLEQELALEASNRASRVAVARQRPRRWLAGFALAAAGLAIGVVAYRHTQTGPATAPLHYAVEGAVLAPGETVVAPATGPAQLTFSDTSQIRLAPGARLAVLAVDGHGSRIALADGALNVSIKHRPDSSWRFDAGPFSVKVTGTSFHLAFDATLGRFGLQMTSGVVEVRGPGSDRVVTLHAGESLELYAKPAASSSRPSSITVEPVSAKPAPTVSPSTTDVPPSAARPVSPAPPASGHRASASPQARRVAVLARGARHVGAVHSSQWAELIARGEFAKVVEDAEQRGIERLLSSASVQDLTSLADAARYTRRADLARRALLALRTRYPGSDRAKEAAFFLGRLAETPSTSKAALGWYATYLDEASDGPYADQAMGRELVLLAGVDRSRARTMARRYLERFPHGAQSNLAKSLLESVSE